jgi:uncharacterized protein (DUF983 family)
MDNPNYPEISPFRAGPACRCPRCGKGKLFSGFLNLRPSCEQCGLDFGIFDPGDGPTVFIILIVGFLVVGLALWTEVRFSPPYWLHLVLWLPTILIASLGLLRPLKGLFIALQYRHKAREHKISDL